MLIVALLVLRIGNSHGKPTCQLSLIRNFAEMVPNKRNQLTDLG